MLWGGLWCGLCVALKTPEMLTFDKLQHHTTLLWCVMCGCRPNHYVHYTEETGWSVVRDMRVLKSPLLHKHFQQNFISFQIVDGQRCSCRATRPVYHSIGRIQLLFPALNITLRVCLSDLYHMKHIRSHALKCIFLFLHVGILISRIQLPSPNMQQFVNIPRCFEISDMH